MATATDTTPWTVLSLITWGAEYFALKGIESARLNIELLLSHVLNCSRVQLYMNFDKPLEARDLASLKQLVQRRIAREPLQYILGSTSFMGFDLRVDRRVLIPRPETELLVEELLLDASRHRRHAILDIGTGSANIAIAVAKHLVDCVVDAVDISAEALSLAAENIRAHGLEKRIVLTEGDVMRQDWRPPKPKYDCIVSNPPYVSEREFGLLEPEIRHFEPSIATSDGGDGLSFYRRIANIGTASLNEGGRIFVEIAYGQLHDVSDIFTAEGYGTIGHRRDYAGIPRCLMITRA